MKSKQNENEFFLFLGDHQRPQCRTRLAASIKTHVQPMLPVLTAAPCAPAATQSLHAAVICSTNASASGLFEPCWLQSYGSTTGVNHPSLVKCCRGPTWIVADGDGAVDEADEVVLLLIVVVDPSASVMLEAVVVGGGLVLDG